MKNPRRRGYAILATAAAVFVLVGMAGLAVDVGRLYIVKSEAQAFADAASIDAATRLNGKISGIDDARAAVLNSVNRFNFNTQQIPSGSIEVRFARSSIGPWENPTNGNMSGYAFVRVTVRPSVDLSFMRALTDAASVQVLGQAVGGQVAQTFPAGGYMPFTPFALNANDPTGNFGMTPGQEYGFLWSGNTKKNDACMGNQVNWPQYNFSDNSSVQGANRGYFELQAASAIRDAIVGATQTSPLNVGDQVILTNGQKQAMQNALVERALMDTDQTNYNSNNSGSPPNYNGNGMRLVVMPVNGGSTSVPPNVVLGFAAFLLPMSYPNQGSAAWCAIYMGSKVQGGGSSAYGSTSGSFIVRLVQ